MSNSLPDYEDADAKIAEHNQDTTAHADIRTVLVNKADVTSVDSLLFVGQEFVKNVRANTSGQSPLRSLLRNSALAPASEGVEPSHNGEIAWAYK